MAVPIRRLLQMQPTNAAFFSLFLEDAPLLSFVASHIPRFSDSYFGSGEDCLSCLSCLSGEATDPDSPEPNPPRHPCFMLGLQDWLMVFISGPSEPYFHQRHCLQRSCQSFWWVFIFPQWKLRHTTWTGNRQVFCSQLGTTSILCLRLHYRQDIWIKPICHFNSKSLMTYWSHV